MYVFYFILFFLGSLVTSQFDIDDKIIGFCILSITSNCMNPECLKILPDHKWVQMSDFIEGNYGDETLTNNNNNSQINNENNSSSSSLSSSDQSTTNLVPEINNLKISRDDHIKSKSLFLFYLYFIFSFI